MWSPNKRLDKNNPPIDWYKGLTENYGGDERAYGEALEKFRKHMFDSKMEKLFDHMMEMNYKEILIETEAFRNILKDVAASELYQSVQELEISVKKDKKTEIVSKYLQILAEAKSLKMCIARLLQRSFDFEDIESYEKEFKIKYGYYLPIAEQKENAPKCCDSCTMF